MLEAMTIDFEVWPVWLCQFDGAVGKDMRNGVESIAKTRRPQPKSNTKNDRVPSVSTSSCLKNKEFKVEEHHRTLLLSKNKKHMSSECNNVKLAIRNAKSEVVYAMCCPNLFMACQLGVLKTHDRKSKAPNKLFLEVLRNRPLWK
nr:hypothetical protein [Tanacetum cinerariifolium]